VRTYRTEEERQNQENPMTRWLANSGLVAAMALLAIDASAGDYPCPPNLGPVTIGGNVVVSGACTLDRTTVDGNVIVLPGGSLVAKRADIRGNVQAEGAKRVRLIRSDVDGDVQLSGLLAASDSRIVNSRVGGNIQLEDNRSPLLVQLNAVAEDVQVNANTGGAVIQSNTIDGNLQCQSNTPAPTGGGNIVGGSKEDQCEAL
jgi:hypothetical protein